MTTDLDHPNAVYTTSAPFYDHIYRFKNYATEVQMLLEFIRQHGPAAPSTLLDVACGTGGHLMYLIRYFECAGVDLAPDLLAIARTKLPNTPFTEGDMLDFDLHRTFDVVTCLFSAIGYLKTPERLRLAVVNMARHVAPGGVLVIEPWLTAEVYRPGHTHADLIETAAVKVARMSISVRRDHLSVIRVHHLVAVTGAEDVQSFIEQHELAMYTLEDFAAAFAAAGLTMYYDAKGLTGRGLYLGRKSV